MELSLLYFPSAVALGALHALEPGHAKTLTAAYLIGVKGTKRDAVLLGLSVAFTHSIVVIGLSLTALWFGEAAFTDNATRTLQLGSAIVVICLGLWMVWKRVRVPTAHPTHSHGAPAPFTFSTLTASGSIQIVDTPNGERMRLTVEKDVPAFESSVHINRGETIERLVLQGKSRGIYESDVAPSEPHDFKAVLLLKTADQQESLSFEMHEPAGHDGHGHDHTHSHNHLSDEEHARAHAATLPDYVGSGVRPTFWQILAFGAAGGMIPCPASVTVMLLALSLKRVGIGLIAVLGFSAGLALTLVGMGLLVVLGLSQLSGSDRFSWISRRAPIVSAVMVVLSGVFALMFAH